MSAARWRRRPSSTEAPYHGAVHGACWTRHHRGMRCKSERTTAGGDGIGGRSSSRRQPLLTPALSSPGRRGGVEGAATFSLLSVAVEVPLPSQPRPPSAFGGGGQGEVANSMCAAPSARSSRSVVARPVESRLSHLISLNPGESRLSHLIPLDPGESHLIPLDPGESHLSRRIPLVPVDPTQSRRIPAKILDPVPVAHVTQVVTPARKGRRPRWEAPLEKRGRQGRLPRKGYTVDTV